MSSADVSEAELLATLVLGKPDYPAASIDASPNFGIRKDGKTPTYLILHYTGLATAHGSVGTLSGS
jgi:N-acetylmuramoyl-L-alanine amidase